MIDSCALVPIGQEDAWSWLWFQRALEARASQQGDSFVGSTRFVFWDRGSDAASAIFILINAAEFWFTGSKFCFSQIVE